MSELEIRYAARKIYRLLRAGGVPFHLAGECQACRGPIPVTPRHLRRHLRDGSCTQDFVSEIMRRKRFPNRFHVAVVRALGKGVYANLFEDPEFLDDPEIWDLFECAFVEEVLSRCGDRTDCNYHAPPGRRGAEP